MIIGIIGVECLSVVIMLQKINSRARERVLNKNKIYIKMWKN